MLPNLSQCREYSDWPPNTCNPLYFPMLYIIIRMKSTRVNGMDPPLKKNQDPSVDLIPGLPVMPT